MLCRTNRQNQICAMLADSWCIKDEIPGHCPPNSSILVQEDQGICNILPTMHCKSVKMEDIWFRQLHLHNKLFFRLKDDYKESVAGMKKHLLRETHPNKLLFVGAYYSMESKSFRSDMVTGLLFADSYTWNSFWFQMKFSSTNVGIVPVR